jgi:deoxyribodipyrimidine photo-lyase
MLSVNFANQEYRSFFFKDQVVLKKRKLQKGCRTPFIHHLKINGWINIILWHPTRVYRLIYSSNFHKSNYVFPSLGEIGFEESNIKVLPYNLKQISEYQEIRDFPAIDGTSYLSPHLRFGTVSVRKMVLAAKTNAFE